MLFFQMLLGEFLESILIFRLANIDLNNVFNDFFANFAHAYLSIHAIHGCPLDPIRILVIIEDGNLNRKLRFNV
jgi:hypothetical protein